MDSILTSIKKLLGIDEDYTHFDNDIIIHINSVFLTLYQLGIGPSTPFVITDKSSTWSDFFETGTEIEAVKSYIYMKVRMMFDPPSSSIHKEALEKIIAEFEWRIHIMEDPTIFET